MKKFRTKILQRNKQINTFFLTLSKKNKFKKKVQINNQITYNQQILHC